MLLALAAHRGAPPCSSFRLSNWPPVSRRGKCPPTLDEHYRQKAAAVLECYERALALAEREEAVLCVDEKPKFQVVERRCRLVAMPKATPCTLKVLSTLPLALTLGCRGHAPTKPETVSSAPQAPVADTSGIVWEVVDRFRLVSDPGGTEQLFRRFESYFNTVNTQINNEGMLGTHWNASAAQYRDGYLNVETWKVKLSYPDPGTCEWRVRRHDAVQGPCAAHVVEVPRGETEVEVRLGNGATHQTSVQPRDVLIASLGDSYASGEGVPDLRKSGGAAFWRWADAKWMDERCHRSLFSAPGLAALMYARINPHVSVTHLTFACSGAELNKGIVEGYAGAIPPKSGPDLRPQVKELRDALSKAKRTPDFLTVSAGGNDIGFADIVSAAAKGNIQDVMKVIVARVKPGLQTVDTYSQALRKELDSAGISPERTKILLPEYPNPTNLWRLPPGTEGSSEEMFRDDCAPGKGRITFLPSAWVIGKVWQIEKRELDRINADVAAPLKDMTSRLAAALGAVKVDGIDEEFKLHGYCAPGLYTPNGTVRWINTVRDSFRMMGQKLGAMHPNIRGQASIARHLFEHIRDTECAPGRISERDPVYAKLCLGTSWRAELPGFEPEEEPLPESEQFPE
jgi:hypothetical protein